jgi:hypothetical protein
VRSAPDRYALTAALRRPLEEAGVAPQETFRITIEVH